MKKKYNISVIGTTCIDLISLPDKDKNFKLFGGTTYLTTALNYLFKSKAEIFLITKLERKYKKDFIKFLENYPYINTNYIYDEPGKTNIVTLIYDSSKSNREEINNIQSTKIKFSQILPVIPKSDIIIITYISGYDISLDTLKYIRKKYDGIIFGDIHSFILKKPKYQSFRGYRNIKHPEKFLVNFDIIQGSELEWQILLKNRFSMNREIYKKAAEYVLSLGCKKMIITLGADGIFGAEKLKNNKIKFYYIKGKKVKKVVDTTGCGDTVTASVVYGLLNKNSFYRGLKLGNKLGAIQAQRIGFFK